eukprot:2141115-Heterocapsa_arctica.AAC.1
MHETYRREDDRVRRMRRQDSHGRARQARCQACIACLLACLLACLRSHCFRLRVKTRIIANAAAGNMT